MPPTLFEPLLLDFHGFHHHCHISLVLKPRQQTNRIRTLVLTIRIALDCFKVAEGDFGIENHVWRLRLPARNGHWKLP